MYKIGDYIVKSNSGVCRVGDILHLEMKGIDKNKWYYLLIPLDDEKKKIYLPIDHAESRIRKVMTKQDAIEFIEQIFTVEEICISNDKLREQKYKEVLKDGSPESLLSIIKTTYLRKKERMEQGKRNTAVDSHYLEVAEKYLFSELCFVLETGKEEIQNLMMESMDKRIKD